LFAKEQKNAITMVYNVKFWRVDINAVKEKFANMTSKFVCSLDRK